MRAAVRRGPEARQRLRERRIEKRANTDPSRARSHRASERGIRTNSAVDARPLLSLSSAQLWLSACESTTRARAEIAGARLLVSGRAASAVRFVWRGRSMDERECKSALSTRCRLGPCSRGIGRRWTCRARVVWRGGCAGVKAGGGGAAATADGCCVRTCVKEGEERFEVSSRRADEQTSRADSMRETLHHERTDYTSAIDVSSLRTATSVRCRRVACSQRAESSKTRKAAIGSALAVSQCPEHATNPSAHSRIAGTPRRRRTSTREVQSDAKCVNR